MKEIKNYQEHTTRYILEAMEDVDAFTTEVNEGNGVGLVGLTIPLMREVLASNLDLVVSVGVKREEGYKPIITNPRLRGTNNSGADTCASLCHKEDLDTPVATIGFNTNNDRYVLRNKAIKRGGDYRDYWDASLKESIHLKNIMKVLRQTMSKIIPEPREYLGALAHQFEEYRFKQMSAYKKGKMLTTMPEAEIEHLIDSGYEPLDKVGAFNAGGYEANKYLGAPPVLKGMIDNYKKNFRTYCEAKKYSPTVYHVRKIANSDDVYIGKFKYPSWVDTQGSTYMTSSQWLEYLSKNPIKEIRCKHADIPKYIQRYVAMLDLEANTVKLTTDTYKSYLENMGMKINDTRYWVIDEDDEVNLDV